MKHLKFYCFSGLKKYAYGSISERTGVSSHRRNSSFSCRERFGPESMAELSATPSPGIFRQSLHKIAQPAVKRQISARDISDIPPQVENGQAKTGKLNIFQLGNYLIY